MLFYVLVSRSENGLDATLFTFTGVRRLHESRVRGPRRPDEGFTQPLIQKGPTR